MFLINTGTALLCSSRQRPTNAHKEEELDFEAEFRAHIAQFARNKINVRQDECVKNCLRALTAKINKCSCDFSENHLQQITNFISIFSKEVEEECFINKEDGEDLISLFKRSLYYLLVDNWSIIFAQAFYHVISITDNKQRLYEVKLWAQRFFTGVKFLCAIHLVEKLIVWQSLLYKTECMYGSIYKEIILNKLTTLMVVLERNPKRLLSKEEETFVKQSIAGDFPYIIENRKAMVSIVWHEYTCQVCNVQNPNFRDAVFGEALKRIENDNPNVF